MALTAKQEEVKQGIIKAISEGVTRIRLIGSAGVGKTYLVSELVKDLIQLANKKNKPVYVTAPTNKALAILMSKINHPVVFKTIHSALRLTRYINPKTGDVSFVPMKYNPNDISKEDFRRTFVCIVDECSMLNSQLIELLDYYNFPIIYVGDGKQLNPVGEEVSPIWQKDYLTFELTEIIRQGEGNPIIDLSRDIDLLYFKKPQLINEKGYTYLEDKYKIIQKLAEVNGTDELKYLSWTNIDVDTMNKLVREEIYGQPKKVELGETLVFNSPYEAYYTNKEVKVQDLSVITNYVQLPSYASKIANDGTLVGKHDTLKMKYYLINNSFKIVHEDSEEIFKSATKTLKFNCSKLAWNWRLYYFFTEQFADVKYNHALTVHKS